MDNDFLHKLPQQSRGKFFNGGVPAYHVHKLFSVTGRISDERFTELSADYEAEQKELKERAARLREELSKAQEATANAEKFMNVVRRHTTIEELTPTLLREFVEKIVVHESVALDGKRRGKLRRQEIEIYYSFVGKVELPDT